MANLEVKGKDGKSVGTHALSEAIASANPSVFAVHRTVVAEEANKRQGTQSAKTRSEVRGGGRKPYKQKKTGNARQGSIRAPHYTHGGMALAVKPRDYDKKVNKKERRAAILGALNSKIQAGDVTIADAITFTEAKTKQAADLLRALELGKARRVLVVLPAYDELTFKCFRNIEGVEVRTAPSSGNGEGEAEKTAVFSARDVLVAHKILIAQDALRKIEEVWAK
ncbi:MAG TPA: 50S ribosomal protein L4 [Fimbriimonadaceae bacterium]|nr:50S ribosomal protein L4 [Fimbriimonadaceae bacterium]